MRHELRTYDDAESLARAAASYVAERARDVLARTERFTMALSGGKSPWVMVNNLVNEGIAWERTTVYQVDERVAPEGSELRNLTHLREALLNTKATIEAMGVNDENLEEAARRYAQLLPLRIDLVHLGLGPDGHCASLVPNDPVLDVGDRLVSLSEPYQGTRRMTLTYPALALSDQLLWLVSGEDKRDALAKLLDGDTSISAGRVEATASLVLCDRQALRP